MWALRLQSAVVGTTPSSTPPPTDGVWEGSWVGGPKRGVRQQRGVKGRSRCSPFLSWGLLGLADLVPHPVPKAGSPKSVCQVLPGGWEQGPMEVIKRQMKLTVLDTALRERKLPQCRHPCQHMPL